MVVPTLFRIFGLLHLFFGCKVTTKIAHMQIKMYFSAKNRIYSIIVYTYFYYWLYLYGLGLIIFLRIKKTCVPSRSPWSFI